MRKNLFETLFKGVAFAMGVAVIVMNTIGTLTAANGMTLLGIGLTTLALGFLLETRHSREPQNG